jgi:hypothetical protein
VWTPKRIFLLAVGFVAFTLVYILYSLTALGRINTLPPLPDQYKPIGGDDIGPIVRVPRVIVPTLLERKLEMAFHPGCEELTWPVRLELNAKSMVIAAWKFELADRGRVKLELMSLALFGKKKNDGREIEINTLKCKQAYITFDQPITSLSPGALSGRKVVEAELFGDTTRKIRITNNRRTADRDDDLVVEITTGPLYYIEKTQIVKTSDHVKLTDGSPTSKDGRLIPRKADIDAEGMQMDLETTAPPPKPGVHLANKTKNETISGVKRIVLKEAVSMWLYVASGAPFPGNDKASGGRQPPVPENNKGLTPPARQEASRSGEPARIHIETPGRFEYELFKDHDQARFDVPTNSNLPNSPQDVTVTRINEQTGNNDILVCKHLELRLKRRNNDTPAPAPREATSPEQGLEIETVHATGPYVTLTSDAEKLDAHGIDFFHDAAKKLTILKGAPYMEANKEDSLIQAPELHIQDIPLPSEAGGTPVRQTATPPTGRTSVPPVPPPSAPVAGTKGPEKAPKTFQQIEASGPGSIHMTNKSTGKQNVHAFWKEKLLSTREGALDKLVLSGAARFVDDEHEESLQAEEIRVWLLPEENKVQAVAVKPAAPPATQQAAAPSAMPGSSRKPHRVEALRNVLAHSPDLNIHDAARLVINFLDVPAERMPPPSSTNNKAGTAPNKPGTAAPDKKPSVADPPPEIKGQKSEVRKEEKRDGTAAALPAAAPAAPAAKSPSAPQPPGNGANTSLTAVAPNQRPGPDPDRPIDLSARSIEAKVLRCNERMALDHLWAEGGALDAVDKRGGVKVRQEPAKPGEEGVYIEGNTLDMTCKAGGNILVVTGDLAQLKMDKILILGPEVNIDQVENKAYVTGEGAMQMQSTTTLEGKPLARPVPLIVHWGDSMFFKGTYAYFEGNIQAEQDSARLACQHLQVYFDRPISLKEGMRGTQPAKVSSLVADKGAGNQTVQVEDQTFEGARLQKYQLLIGRELLMTSIPRDDGPQAGKGNDANKVTLHGPGSVRILQRGDSDLTITPGNPTPKQPVPAKKDAKDQVMKLTYVSFMGQMQANSLTNVATFWESVRVLNFPCDDPHCDIDLDDMLSKELPEGALFLRCKILRVSTYQKTIGGGTEPKQVRTYQTMDAIGQVYVQGKDFTAQCDHMTFNEEKDQVIFQGENGNEAVMTKGDPKGIDRKHLKDDKIIYIRSTGEVILHRVRSIDG